MKNKSIFNHMIYPNDLKFCNNGDLVVSNVFIKGKFYDAVIQGAPKAGEETAYHIDQIARIKECVQKIYARERKKEDPLTVSFFLFSKKGYTRILNNGERVLSQDPRVLTNLQKIDNILNYEQVVGVQQQDNGEPIVLSAQPYVPKEKPPAGGVGGVDSSSDSKPSRGATTRKKPRPHSLDDKGEGTAEKQSAQAQEIPPTPIPDRLVPPKGLFAKLDGITYKDGITLRQLREHAKNDPKEDSNSELDKLYRSYLELFKNPSDENEAKTLEWFQELYKGAYKEFNDIRDETMRAFTAATAVAGFIHVKQQSSLKLVQKLVETEI